MARFDTILYIEWEDSWSPAGAWRDPDSFTVPDVCKSIGWLVYEDEKWIGVAGHIDSFEEDSTVAGTFLIPKSCIKKKKKVTL
tara:strand:+ start:93 stop:341 length:249 start_codon:yes stop_codon:yes gene_type:complete